MKIYEIFGKKRGLCPQTPEVYRFLGLMDEFEKAAHKRVRPIHKSPVPALELLLSRDLSSVRVLKV
jgi:hypothetical protein